jgi:hypothetical protein
MKTDLSFWLVSLVLLSSTISLPQCRKPYAEGPTSKDVERAIADLKNPDPKVRSTDALPTLGKGSTVQSKRTSVVRENLM